MSKNQEKLIMRILILVILLLVILPALIQVAAYVHFHMFHQGFILHPSMLR